MVDVLRACMQCWYRPTFQAVVTAAAVAVVYTMVDTSERPIRVSTQWWAVSRVSSPATRRGRSGSVRPWPARGWSWRSRDSVSTSPWWRSTMPGLRRRVASTPWSLSGPSTATSSSVIDTHQHQSVQSLFELSLITSRSVLCTDIQSKSCSARTRVSAPLSSGISGHAFSLSIITRTRFAS